MGNYNFAGELVKAAHECANLSLVRCTSGNMSAKINGTYYITAAEKWFSRLTISDLVECDSSGTVLHAETDRVPTPDSPIHFGIYADRTDVNVILHCQSDYATICSCVPRNINNLIDITQDFSLIPEVPFYLDKIALIPYSEPETQSFIDDVIDAASQGYNMILLQNHGQYVLGSDFDDVLHKATFFELAARIYGHTTNAKTLSNTAIVSLRNVKKTKDHISAKKAI